MSAPDQQIILPAIFIQEAFLMILRTIISEEKDRLLKEAERVESRLKKAPPGTLITFNDHGHVKYYQEIKIRGKRKRKYLRRKRKSKRNK